MNFGYIYKTTNLIDNKIYIGKNSGQYVSSYYGSGLYLQRALKKHGRNNFKVEIIAWLPTEEQLDEFEIFLIAKYREILGRDKMYNISDGGDGKNGITAWNKGIAWSEEIKKRMSESKKGIPTGRSWNKGQKMSKECCAKISKANKGRPAHNKGIPCTEETRRKISASLIGKTKGIPKTAQCKEKLRLANLGKKHTIESRIKMSQSLKGKGLGKKLSEETKQKISETLKRKGCMPPWWLSSGNTGHKKILV